MKSVDRHLRVFLCHSSNDKPAVRELYQKLRAEPWIQPWLDEEELYPGQDWNLEIEKAVEAADAIIVCLSKGSITKEGYVQRELRIVLDYADYKPEGTLYLMPVRLEECEPPRRLRPWQYADYFEGNRERALQRLLVSLKRRAESLDLTMEEPAPNKESKEKKSEVKTPVAKAEPLSKPAEKKPLIETPRPAPVAAPPPNKLTLSNDMEFMRVPAGKFLMGSTKENKSAYDDERPQHTVDIPYDYWMARFPVTNAQYNQFKKKDFDKGKENHPVVRVNWNDAMEYCKWLNQLMKAELPSDSVLRLPTESEWEKAARGTDGREYPWGNTFDKNKCNTDEGGKGGTTPVGLYSQRGDSPYGCADMGGNVWEWTHSLKQAYPYKFNDGREDEKTSGRRVLRGGSFLFNVRGARCACRYAYGFAYFGGRVGFRVVVASPILS
ncbi:MAG: SUMF1/EgtB/PvdO family nonheme iron enzyme [Chloroflexi bacterium]|nr:SUMF1/EgtB/PvdO family nonheme iron enzyme [Chloroflexota bacterium]